MEHVFELLNREWSHIGSDPSLSSRLPEPLALVGVTTLDAVVERDPRLRGEARDQLHRAILRRAVAGDDFAARLELQLLLPGAGRLAARFWGLGDPDERASAAVAAVYGAIRTYPLTRRPRFIPANIVVAAARQLRREVAHPHRHVALVPGVLNDLPCRIATPHPADELADLLTDAVRAGRLTATDARLIAATRIHGCPLADLAETAGCSLRSLQRRRRSAESALRAMAVAA